MWAKPKVQAVVGFQFLQWNDPCPLRCGGVVEQVVSDRTTYRKPIGSGGDFGQTDEIYEMACTGRRDGCSWRAALVPGKTRWSVLTPAVVEKLGLDGCRVGHQFCWSPLRKVAGRQDLICTRSLGNGRCCGQRRGVGAPRGFVSRPRNPAVLNRTKAQILLALHGAGDVGLTHSEVMAETALTSGQVSGALRRGESAGVLNRGSEWRPPGGARMLYRISELGVLWVEWGSRQGFYTNGLAVTQEWEGEARE